MHADLKGFYNAPVSFAMVCICFLFSSINFMSEQRAIFNLVLSKLLRNAQYWRLLTCHLGFDIGAASCFGLYLIYHFRVIERQFGSKKFGSFIALVLMISTMIQLGLLVVFPSLRSLSGGPYAIISALTTIYYYNIPKVYPRLYSFLGLHISDKSSVYLLLLLLILQGWRVFIPIFSGVVAGSLYVSDILPLRDFRLPRPILRFFSIFAPLLEVTPPSVLRQRRRQQMQQMQRALASAVGGADVATAQGNGQGFRDQLLPGARGGVMGGWAPAAGPQFQVAAPPNEAIDQLTSLGFDREAVIRALIASGNNVEAAANRLLNRS